MIRYSFECPHCEESSSLLMDTEVEQQDFIEDCEVCHEPVEISIGIRGNQLTEFTARVGE